MSKKLRDLFIISYLSIQLTSGHNYTKILNFKFNKANTYLVFENLNFWQPWSQLQKNLELMEEKIY